MKIISMKEMLMLIQEDLINLKPNERIGYLRRYKNMNQCEMAEKCIATQKSVWSWESGKSVPSKENKKLIASALGFKKEMIFGQLERYKF